MALRKKPHPEREPKRSDGEQSKGAGRQSQRTRVLPRAILGSAIALALFAVSARADPVKLRIGWSDVPSSLTPILGETPELAPHLGKSYTLDPIHFGGTAPMI